MNLTMHSVKNSLFTNQKLKDTSLSNNQQIKSKLNWLELCCFTLRKKKFASNADSDFHLNHLRFMNFFNDFLFGSFGILVFVWEGKNWKILIITSFLSRSILKATKVKKEKKLETKGTINIEWKKKEWTTSIKGSKPEHKKKSTKFNKTKK